jgi:hypothetical protein
VLQRSWVGKTVVITGGKGGADIFRRVFTDVWKDVIVAKCIAQLRDNIASHIAVNVAHGSRGNSSS